MHPSSASPVRVPDAGIYMVGMAVFPSHNPFHSASPSLHSVSQPPSSVIEVRRYLSLISFFFLMCQTHSRVYFIKLLLLYFSDAVVPCTELCSGRSSVLPGICHSEPQLTSQRPISDIQTSLSLSRHTPAAPQ